jgi:hypothetical protein
MALAGATAFVDRADLQDAALLADADAIRKSAAEFPFGSLHGDREAIEAHGDLVGNGDRGFTNT